MMARWAFSAARGQYAMLDLSKRGPMGQRVPACSPMQLGVSRSWNTYQLLPGFMALVFGQCGRSLWDRFRRPELRLSNFRQGSMD